jgi:hypothetical protein
VDDEAVDAPVEVLRIVPARELDLLRRSGFLPCVEVGSGLPPSAQTSRSIISLSALEVLYQCVGVTMTTACAATQRS